MRQIKIVGHGDIVKDFLAKYTELYTNLSLQIYSRSTIDSFTAKEDDIIFYCCSTNEESILQQSLDTHGRFCVAQHNILITRELIKNEIFNAGIVFVVTNPSDLIAEYIYKHTNNKRVYAVGAEIDKQRYAQILLKLGLAFNYNIIGTHSEYPIIDADEVKNFSLILMLREKLKEQIKSEFSNFKPPIKSGAFGIASVLQSLREKKMLYVSHWIKNRGHFAIGLLEQERYKFKALLSSNFVSEKICEELFANHQKNYIQLEGINDETINRISASKQLEL
jgi:hypothetical protein